MSEGRLTTYGKDEYAIRDTSIRVVRITDSERLQRLMRDMYESTKTRDIGDDDAPKPGDVAWARGNVWAVYNASLDGERETWTFWEPATGGPWGY